jgi:ferric-dicitrate binding protein FerR (iron transport regulator)
MRRQKAGRERAVMKNRLSQLLRRARLPAAALILSLLALAAPPAARAQELAAMPAPWIVAEVQGPVMVRYDRGAWQQLDPGAAIAAASEIRTGRDAHVVLVRGADRVRLRAHSYLELPPAERDGGVTRLMQWLGEALFEVDPRPSPQFEVDTPYLTAVVKGTAFSIEVSRDGATVAVTSGTVRVATLDGAATDLTTGRIAHAYAGLSGLIVEDAAGPADAAPATTPDHAWPEPTFDPIPNTLPRY